MDGRRHSIDIPISRTLVALRRVRSLRDPSTNSMSKLTALVDDVNWETNSNNAITLGFEDGFHGVGNDDNVPNWRRSSIVGEEEQYVSDHERYYGSRNARPLDPDMLCNDKALSERYYKDYGEKDLELTYGTTPSSDQAGKRRNGGSKCRNRHRKLDGLSRVTAHDVLSRAGSPCLSVSEAPKERLGNEMPLYRNEEVGFMDSCHQGCGIGSCWTRTRKCRESNLLHDAEEQPLLLENTGQVLSTRDNMDCEGLSPYEDSCRSLCQKFMPKSFSELVGQNTVATSLLNAISKRQITSLYLFHGPRGTGKTSASRIFSAALNCLSTETSKPCGLCQECDLFFSGKTRDVIEVDSVRINKAERCRLLIKNAGNPPVFSRFKVYVIEECHLLQRETWAAILNNLEELPRHVVFIMVTPNLDKLPRSAVSKSQKYHFQKVKEVDITSKLGKICVQEGLDFDQDALNFIATKSNGSLRDAEMMLDQLSLLGKKITMPLVYEVNGVVSDDELLDLLYMALSSDASNTVKMARELMSSRIDPLQLVSQLASLIMDILAGKCPDGASEKRRNLFGNNSEADMQQLSHALKILSQTEKQLRMSNNQTTWLTVALLQLSSKGSSHDVNDARLSMRSIHPQDGDFLSTSSTSESLKRPVESGKTGLQFNKETLELVWIRAATQMCISSSLKKFLLKRGKLLSIRLNQGIAVVEMEFDHSDYVSKAEKSWKVIASALQHMLGYNVELRINLARNDSTKNGKFKRPSFSLFNCSRRVHLKSSSSAECRSNASENSKYIETCSSDCGSQISCSCCHGQDLFKTIRTSDGNALSIEPNTLPNSALKPGSKEHSKFHCWRTAIFSFRKAWQLRHNQPSERLVDNALHCAN